MTSRQWIYLVLMFVSMGTIVNVSWDLYKERGSYDWRDPRAKLAYAAVVCLFVLRYLFTHIP